MTKTGAETTNGDGAGSGPGLDRFAAEAADQADEILAAAVAPEVVIAVSVAPQRLTLAGPVRNDEGGGNRPAGVAATGAAARATANAELSAKLS